MASDGEAEAMVRKATVPAKLQHKHALQQAILQVEQENAELQRQYSEQLPRLQAASADISSCMARMQQVRGTAPPPNTPHLSPQRTQRQSARALLGG